MSGSESPELLAKRASGEVSVEDVRALTGASTPHFALQLAERISALIAPLPADHPARVEGERELARLQAIAFHGEERDERPPSLAEGYERPLPSLAP
ncbi:MAG TPA: hypothetical protein VKU89_08290 [Solirubrobacteraceae bacterium]|nr:hypothetical protein [Solirubrobacteraceae bacterium]